ncbi:DUF998 domain-containing protein [Actinocatenispora rupis]|uniref:DUF998 domain-containing protein n=1 Tax=Actinocatenispora rupis TaxID=519421 RepID=A0A8J3IZK4_9ACTN|nr:DUF998 domain-containing protein [Actinocatenispora rupis]GID09242.1 hypothetical protein Aru02nite_01310 [Actinocatenispora rupis]
MRSVRGAAVVSLSLLAVAVAVIGYLHLTTGISPVSGMISDYVFTHVGAVLLPVAVLALAGGLMVLRRGLAATGVSCRGTGWLLLTAALGAALIAFFRADPAGAAPTATGLVHKAAGGLLFGSMPVAGWLLARRFADRYGWRPLATRVRRLAVVAGGLFALFLVTYLPLFGVPLPGGTALVDVQGLAERLVLLPELALVVLVAVRLTRPVPVWRTPTREVV